MEKKRDGLVYLPGKRGNLLMVRDRRRRRVTSGGLVE